MNNARQHRMHWYPTLKEQPNAPTIMARKPTSLDLGSFDDPDVGRESAREPGTARVDG